MINKKTTIVVGAGASADLGMPVGDKLKEKIAARFASQRGEYFDSFSSAAYNSLDRSASRLNEVLMMARRLAEPLRQSASIDNFLDQRRQFQDFVTLGKLAIAHELTTAEHSSKLSLSNPNHSLISQADDYFLRELLNITARGHQETDIEDSLANLNFVIFNYDRCVERYISEWLREHFGNHATPYAQAANYIHVYGSLGNYFESENVDTFTRPSGSPLLNPHFELPKIQSRIKLFTEQEDSEIHDAITNACIESDCIIFLGFGFEEQNMRFFDHRHQGKRVFATLYGMSQPNQTAINTMLHKRFCNAHEEPMTANLGCRALFVDYYHPITSAVASLPIRVE